jgi:hypothetical protein
MDLRTLQLEAHKEYTGWLSNEIWDCFLTLTDPGLSHPEAMYKRTRYYMNTINRFLYGRNFYKRGQGIEHVIGLERQKRGSVHSHSLIRFPDHDISDRNQFNIIDWNQRANDLGGWAKLERPRDSKQTVDYVTKYVCKGGEIYISENFNPRSPNAFSHTLLGQ